MATVTPSYAASTAITIGLATTPLASSSSFTTGRESAEQNNTSDKYDDAFVSGKITVGTTPTINTQILVYVWGADTSLGTTAIGPLDGTDSDESWNTAGEYSGFLKLGAALQVDATTSNRTYNFAFGVANLFGGIMPKYWGLFVTHNTGVALNSTAGNHAITFQGIKYDIS